jgi:NAD(P)-dependent dehydrogenase (short-subunit alcohol dehydrogenase family)
MKIELQNKSILVTGANSGIGYAIASELLKAGAKVALHYNSNSNGVLVLLKISLNFLIKFHHGQMG